MSSSIATTGPSKKRRLLSSSTIPSLVAYPFLVPLFLEYLSDKDVLQRLLIAGKAMRPSLIDYRVKGSLTPDKARQFTGWHRYLSVQPTRIIGWKGEHLRHYTSLRYLAMHLNADFNQPLLQGDLPLSLQVLQLGNNFNQPLSHNTLPPQLKELIFGRTYNHPLQVGVLPMSLKSICFDQSFNQVLVPGAIPNGVSTIEFSRGRFNQPLVAGVFPDSVTNLSMSFHSINSCYLAYFHRH